LEHYFTAVRDLEDRMLQRLGVEANSFATSTGTLRGLEPG